MTTPASVSEPTLGSIPNDGNKNNKTSEPITDKTSDKNSWPSGLRMRNSKGKSILVVWSRRGLYKTMSKDSTLSDLEIRIAFLEDQIDALNREVVSLNRDRDKLTEELQALAHLIRPLIAQMSSLGGTDDSAPPPHY
ncbi:MAG TPA: hypothetical protein DCY28_07035 [Gammaproteobacteria bacterium]|jgi:uncharacterized coiled-coil protein SlyX|nr:hypothetical protein [Gammaproteobacteria bacterium]HAY55575.1 hypothetical protein [Gammaproteobacteria bacterium]